MTEIFRAISRLASGNNFESYSTGNIETEKKEEAREEEETDTFRKPDVGGGE